MKRRAFWERLGLASPSLVAWALYDWANSAFMTTVVAAIFPIYFAEVVAAEFSPAEAQGRYAAASAIALLAVALVAPMLGAVADRMAIRKRLLFFFAVTGSLACGGLFFATEGDWIFALVCFGLGNFGAGASAVFYDALLPHLVTPEKVDRASTAGFALGYLGGGLLLAVNLAWILKPSWFGLPAEGTLGPRLAFLSVALWWFVFTLPLMRRVPEPPALLASAVNPGKSGLFVGVRQTLAEIRQYPEAFKLLVAFLLYNDGILTIIRMAAIFGAGLGLASGDMILALLLVQFVGIPCSFLFGAIADKVGTKHAILGALGVYGCVALLGYYMQTSWHFFVLAGLVALVQGGAQALSRSLFSSLVPRQKSAEFFGFFAVGEKFAGVLGPTLFAVVALNTGSSRSAMLWVLGFFVVGGGLLARVNVQKGREQARAAEASFSVST